MPAEQIPLIELTPMRLTEPDVEPMDLYLVVAWNPYRTSTGKTVPSTRSKVEQFKDLARAQKFADEISANWWHRQIFHCRIGGE